MHDSGLHYPPLPIPYTAYSHYPHYTHTHPLHVHSPKLSMTATVLKNTAQKMLAQFEEQANENQEISFQACSVCMCEECVYVYVCGGVCIHMVCAWCVQMRTRDFVPGMQCVYV
jgi:hypothetical protein